jgi:hypothetical protein
MTATLTPRAVAHQAATPRERARDLVRTLNRLDPTVQAELADWRPSCMDSCRHDDCPAVVCVRVLTDDPLTGRPIDEEWCAEHGHQFMVTLLTDPHRDDEEPPQIRAEVAPV